MADSKDEQASGGAATANGAENHASDIRSAKEGADAGNKFQQAVAAWRTLDLSKLVSTLDVAASELVSQQRDSLLKRKCAYRCVLSAKEIRTLPTIAVTMPMRLDQSSEVKSFPPPNPKEVCRTRSLYAFKSSESAAFVVVAGMYMAALRPTGASFFLVLARWVYGVLGAW